MNRKLSAIIIGASVALVGIAGAAAAYNGGDGLRQSAKHISTSNDDLVQNDFYTDIGGEYGDDDNGNAVANCQWLLSVNAIFINAVAIESLGLISEEDERELEWGPIGTLQKEDAAEQVVTAHNGTASCEQEIGAVRVTMSTFDGFGEAPPLDGGFLTASGNGPYKGGGGSLSQKVRDVYAGNDDMVQNDADVHIYGSGNAVANCQFLVGWNTVGVNLATIDQDGTVTGASDDKDMARALAQPENGDSENDAVNIDNSYASGTATCKQTVASIDLHIGDDVFIPPQS